MSSFFHSLPACQAPSSSRVAIIGLQTCLSDPFFLPWQRHNIARSFLCIRSRSYFRTRTGQQALMLRTNIARCVNREVMYAVERCPRRSSRTSCPLFVRSVYYQSSSESIANVCTPVDLCDRCRWKKMLQRSMRYFTSVRKVL